MKFKKDPYVRADIYSLCSRPRLVLMAADHARPQGYSTRDLLSVETG